MKFIYIISFIILSFSGIAQGTVIDKIAAQVGDNIILLSDIQSQKLQALQAGMTLDDNTDCFILEQMMYQNLLLNQAKLDSIEVSDAQVDAEMEQRIRVIENQIGGRDKMEEFYGKSITQIKIEFRDQIRDQLLSQEMERQITANVSVTPKEVQEFYHSMPLDSLPLINSKMSFQQIVIYPEVTDADKKRAFDELQDIRTNVVVNGKSFSTQARIYSQDPGSASQGGEIKATRGMMVPQFEAAVFNLKVGEVSDVFESPYGYHIVKLIERKGDDYTCQHILIIPEFSTDALLKASYRMDSCYNRLKANEITWDQAVLTYSNDDATKFNNGMITNPITGEQSWSMEDLGQVDREIYLITDRLNEGEISEPNIYDNYLERKKGVRIVRLAKRTAPHRANLKDDYTLIQSAAAEQKKQGVIFDWTEQKIHSAYIKIDEEFQSCGFQNTWIVQ